MHDGALIFKTKIDNADVQKDLNKVKREIEKTMESISKAETERMPLLKQAEDLKKKLQEARAELSYIKDEQSAAQAAIGGPSLEEHMAALDKLPELDEAAESAKANIEKLEKNWAKVNDKVEDYNQKIENAKNSLEAQKEKAADLTKQLSSGSVKMAGAMEKAQGSAAKFSKRIKGIISQVFVFTLISKALQAITKYMGKTLKSNQKFTAELAKLKGALLTAFQPIYEVLVPALMSLMRVATNVVTAVARVTALLGGKSMSEYAKSAKALYEEANAIEQTGEAAKKAEKSLAGFDEINKLGSGTEDASATDNSVVNPDFTDFGTDDVTDCLNEILQLVTAIAAGLLTWKIASVFTNNLSLVAGLALSVGGALLYATSIADAFVHGIDWGNFTGMLTGTTALVGGLALALGTTGAAVGALVAGIGMIVVSLYEWITTGNLTIEALATLEAGIIAVGVAVALFTGLWIPLLIAAVVGAVVAILTKGEEIKAGLQKLDDWLQTVFVRDWTEIFGPMLGGALNYLFSNLQQWWGGI